MKKVVNRRDIREAYRGKKILITGGTGFIGSNLARELVRMNASVTLMDSFLPDHGANMYNIEGIEDRVQVSRTDIRDRDAVDKNVRDKDIIFSLAAQGLHIDSMIYPDIDLDINCRGNLNILESCRTLSPGVKVVYASTRQVYGKPEYVPVDEKHPLQPVDVNSINKIAAEHYHYLYHTVHGLHTTTLRLTNTYGPRQLMKHSRGNFAAWFIRQAMDGEEIHIFGDGLQLRDFTYIDDAVDAFLLSGVADSSNGEVFNLGGERPYSLREYVGLLCKMCPGATFKTEPFPEERQRIDVGSVYNGYDKIKNKLGWSPGVYLEEGLTRTIDFYRENRTHYW